MLSGPVAGRARAELGRTLGEELLEPTRIYARDCLALAAATEVHAYAHVTGGGLAGNLARVLPPTVDAVVDRSTWTPPPVFELVARLGPVAPAEIERTLNMGVGHGRRACPTEPAAVRLLADRGVPAWVAGEVAARHRSGPPRRHPLRLGRVARIRGR